MYYDKRLSSHTPEAHEGNSGVRPCKGGPACMRVIECDGDADGNVGHMRGRGGGGSGGCEGWRGGEGGGGGCTWMRCLMTWYKYDTG